MRDDIQFIGRNSDRYPARFQTLPDMPDGLYVIGDLPEDNTPSVALIGARMCSRYGRNIAFEFGRELAENGVAVISGMALGIDGAAQEGAIAGHGKTYAVLGCGVDVCYPASNRSLYDQIPKHGGILSELKPGTGPMPYHFPTRNRLISALADVVVVVEARKKSGSLITVDCALNQGRSVYAVPGRVGDALSDGCNLLIAQGAGIAWSVEAIMEELILQKSLSDAARASRAKAQARLSEAQKQREGWGESRMPVSSGEDTFQTDAADFDAGGGSALEGRILNHLRSDEKTMDELADELCLEITELSAVLGEMLLKGLVEEVGRGRYAKPVN